MSIQKVRAYLEQFGIADLSGLDALVGLDE